MLNKNEVIQAVASACPVAIPRGTDPPFLPEIGDEIVLGAPIYSAANTTLTLYEKSIALVVRWPVTNNSEQSLIIQITYTIVSSDWIGGTFVV